MYFVRHATLRPPFNDYGKLTLAQLDRLATHMDDPQIELFAKEDVCDELVEVLKNGNPVHCSPSLRTRETYEFACAALGLQPRSPVIDDRLKEVWFRPSGFVRENERPLDAIRARLYECLIEGSMDTEPFEELLARVDGLLDDPELQEAICFTHGFLIRFIKVYVAVDRDRKLLPDALKNSPPIEYLGCFKTN
jgi:broad specificity phosphatase PhoE